MRAKDIRLKGPRVAIRPLRRQDLDTMSTWVSSDDPLYRLFDWPQRAPLENSIWFSELVRDRTRVYYAVENEWHTLIGRISLREIRGRESARLGIGLGTDFVGQGYGTEALQVFLRYYFLELGFERMVLDVSAINERAIRCYERCGFKRSGSHYEYVGSDPDVVFLEEEPYKHLQRFVRRRGRRNYALSYDMVLEREDWLEQEYAQKQPAS